MTAVVFPGVAPATDLLAGVFCTTITLGLVPGINLNVTLFQNLFSHTLLPFFYQSLHRFICSSFVITLPLVKITLL